MWLVSTDGRDLAGHPICYDQSRSSPLNPLDFHFHHSSIDLMYSNVVPVLALFRHPIACPVHIHCITEFYGIRMRSCTFLIIHSRSHTQSSSKHFRFRWPVNHPNLSFSPATGHLHACKSTDVTLTFNADTPTKLSPRWSSLRLRSSLTTLPQARRQAHRPRCVP